MAVTFALFGTLVAVDRPDDPATALARELDARGVPVPTDWPAAYRERHVEAPAGAAVPLPAHVARALRSRGVDPAATAASGGDSLAGGDPGVPPAAEGNLVRRAVVAAFDPAVTTREGAPRAVAAAAGRGPVGVCSNCAVPELARRALIRSGVDRAHLDTVVTSAGCGWRKPDPRAFEAAARRLGVDPVDLVHVGDDPRTDGGVREVGGTFLAVPGGGPGLEAEPPGASEGTAHPPSAELPSLAAFPDRIAGPE